MSESSNARQGFTTSSGAPTDPSAQPGLNHPMPARALRPFPGRLAMLHLALSLNHPMTARALRPAFHTRPVIENNDFPSESSNARQGFTTLGVKSPEKFVLKSLNHPMPARALRRNNFLKNGHISHLSESSNARQGFTTAIHIPGILANQFRSQSSNARQGFTTCLLYTGQVSVSSTV